jgi:Mg2+ and Co2+ transporter CorA
MAADGHLLLVLHATPRADEPERAARLFWRSPDGAWQSNFGPGIAALQRHLADYHTALEKLDDWEDTADLSKEFFEMLQQIAPLRRATRNLHETLQQARELAPEDSDLIACRDQAYALQRRAELVESDIRAGLECAIARRAEEQAESSHRMAVSAHRLNILATIFFPVATVSAIFGMNLSHGLERSELGPGLFWLVLLGGFLIGLILKAVVIDPLPKPQRANRRAAEAAKTRRN